MNRQVLAAERIDAAKSLLDRPVVWLLLIAFVSVPFLLAAYPPAPDYYNHVGRLYVMLHKADPAIARYYAFHWRPIGNLGADLIVLLLGPWIGVEPASRIAFGMAPALCAGGLLALSRVAHGRVQPTVLLALPLVYSFSLSYGFVNYSLAMALAFVFGAIWIGLKDKPRLQSAFAAVAGGLVWVCHFVGFGIFLILIGSTALVWTWAGTRHLPQLAWRSLKLVLPACWPLLLTLLWRSEPGSHPLFFAFSLKPYWVADVLRTDAKWFDRASAAFLLCATAALTGLWAMKPDRKSAGVVLAGAVLSLVFLVMPNNVFSSGFADSRLVAPSLMLLLVGVPAPQRAQGLLAIVCATFLVTRLVYVSEAWERRSGEIARELAVLDQVPRGSRIAVLAHASGCKSWPLLGDDTIPSLAIARKGTFVNTEWDIAGSQLMRPIYNDHRDFNDSTSTQVSQAGTKCPGAPLEQRLAALPRERFDYVWSFAGEAREPWLQAIARGPRGTLYHVSAPGT